VSIFTYKLATYSTYQLAAWRRRRFAKYPTLLVV